MPTPDAGSRPQASGPSDAELARDAASGDREAFAAIYERHRTVVYRFARLMSGSNATAEDVTQEVFVTLIQTLPSYDPQRAALLTYLYGVTRNVTRNWLRRDRRGRSAEADRPASTVKSSRSATRPALDTAARTPCSSADDPHDAAVRAQERARLRRAILSLPSRYREVIILADVQGLAYAEAARILQVPVGTVRSRLSRGRQMMALTLRKTEAPEGLPVVRLRAGLRPQAAGPS